MAAVLKPDFAATEERYNIYTVVHKGLRGFMTDTLNRWGRADMTDEIERNDAIAQVLAVLDMLTGHLQHENEFIHTALEIARKGAAARTAHDHIDHEAAIAGLRACIAEFQAAPGHRLTALGQQFYLRLSAFVAENLEHMIVEETDNHAELARAYTDEQILEIEHRIVASINPAEAFAGLRWMIGHSNAQERAFFLGGMKPGVPPEVFKAVMGLAREVLTEREYYKLELAVA